MKSKLRGMPLRGNLVQVMPLRVKKLIDIFKSKKGASLLIVLSVMSLLVALGASVLVAAGAGQKALENRQAQDQLLLYADSLQKTVRDSLQAGAAEDNGKDLLLADVANQPSTLGGQLLTKMYKEVTTFKALDKEADASLFFYRYQAPLDPIEIAFDLNGDLKDSFDTYTKTVKITMHPQMRIEKDYIELVPEFDANGIIVDTQVQMPRNVDVEGDITVTVKAEHKGKQVTSVVTYRYTKGNISSAQNADGTPDISKLLIKNAGEWGIVSHEKVDR